MGKPIKVYESIFVESRNGNILIEDSEISKDGQNIAINSITIQYIQMKIYLMMIEVHAYKRTCRF